MKYAVIFDMDGVVIDNGRYHMLAWEEFCKRHRISFSEEKFNTVLFGRTNEEILPDLFMSDFSKKELEELGNEKETIYREIYRPELKPAPGFLHFLNGLKENGIPVGLATSAPKENVEFVLRGLAIRDLFNVVVDDSMVSKGKPDPEIYIKAASLLNMSPHRCVVFEDSLSGTRAAFDAGAKVVAITTTLPAEDHRYAHCIVPDFTEITLHDVMMLISEKKQEG